MMAASSVIAQNNTNSLPPIPAPVTTPAATEAAPATNAPAAKPVKHKRAAAPKKISEPTVTLVPGPAEVAANSINARGQAGLKGEVVAHLAKGETVTVLDQINLSKHKADEPAQWAKISYPTNANVWVLAKYIDANKSVLPKKLNLRAGPGENYSVVGVVEHGTPITEIETKGNWMKIQPSPNTYAFVAAMYLKQEAPAPAPEAAPAPAPTPTPVPETQPIASTPPMPQVIPPTIDTNLPRVVSHEGVVGRVGSPIAPTKYELYDPETFRSINYLSSPDQSLDLGRYVGCRIIVTGEEGLAKRWNNTPVLDIQNIIVLATNAVPVRHATSPHGAQRH